MYDRYKDTELEIMFELLTEDVEEINIETIGEELYNHQKVLKLDGELEVEKFINSSRRKMRWKAYMERIGDNLEVILERFDNPGLHSNQVLLTNEYDDQTSEEEIPGFDYEARKQAELDKKKDMVTKLIGNQLF